MEFTFIEALLIGVLYYLTWTDFQLFPFSMYVYQDPVVIGFILGLAYGDVASGLIIGGSIALLYISNAAVGANLPSDSSLAACVAIPIALKFGLSPEMAVTLAVPFGVLGALLDNVRRLSAGFWHRRAQKHVDLFQLNKLTIDAVFGPLGVNIVLRILPLTLLLFLFGSSAGEALNSLPAWISHGFNVIGGMLPGLGLILCVTFIGRKDLLPYFVIGYYVAYLTGWGTLTLAILAGAIAFLHVQFTRKDEDDEEDFQEESTGGNALTTGDINHFSARLLMFYRVSQSIEYFYGTGVCYAMLPFLKKIYKDDTEGLKAALKRHLAPFITNPHWGACVLTASLAMEESIAAGSPESETLPQVITSMKSGLMGPFAGIGDTVDGMTTWPILKAIFYPFALAGSPLALLMTPILVLVWNAELFISARLGYTAGRTSLLKVLNGSRLRNVLVGAGVLGTAMMGALAASYVKLSTPLSFVINETPFAVQAWLDMILPGLLPMAMLMGVYFALNKGVKFIRIIVAIVVLGLVGSLVGIL
jgi:mannose/fructose/N-acetylgalactosamine-specific phosphotransferase system component IID/mannose/fructose/N-acetylgalactosamine-specific phosphotransferase system component IIC